MIVLWIFLGFAVLIPIFTITFAVLKRSVTYHKARLLERIEVSVLGITAVVTLGLLFGAGF